MKREHITSQSYIDWLRSLGCIVYLPLSADGDLQDRISGIDIVQDNGSFQWNASKQMYQFNVPSTYGGAAVLRNGFDNTMFTTNSLTFCVHFKKLQNLSGGRTLLINKNVVVQSEFNVLYNGSSNMTNMPSDYSYAHTLTSNEILTSYQQGQYYNSWDVNNNQYNNKPSEWIINQNDKGLWLGCYTGNSSQIGSYCMGEIYIFDGVLDLTTIRKIQGYE